MCCVLCFMFCASRLSCLCQILIVGEITQYRAEIAGSESDSNVFYSFLDGRVPAMSLAEGYILTFVLQCHDLAAMI